MPVITDLEVHIVFGSPERRREVYDRACLDAGVESTNDGYWRWREIAWRLSGESDFEVQLHHASIAMAQIGIAASAAVQGLSTAFSAFRSLAAKAMKEEEDHVRRQRYGVIGAIS